MVISENILFESDMVGNKEQKKYYFKMYTILFMIVALVVFSWYFLTGHTLIYKNDGWDQHYKALIYYAKYLRFLIEGGVKH